ncbi:hypothetical protein GP486_005085 [Trichoglossum hirsutum]|uniref:Yeast cell wall synthesis Kre9/Knh1-like N-terminal domain-containing protein n=1 Tax=Trichoglossum hirsutum TaxID=265104 RepID=A0A9P8RNG8_9PEZI|nr:hypothetical protein GP486_005085 [Trichoglossum hirsutum]
MRFSLAAILASAASLAAAVTTPVGDPSGNPINKPGLGEIVPVGKPYAITWNELYRSYSFADHPTMLCRSPHSQVCATVVSRPPWRAWKRKIADFGIEGIDNTGTFMWTPDTSLEDDVTHYGLQLIVDATGQYQYSTQFGISNPNGPTSGASASASATAASNSTLSLNSTTTYSTTTVVSTSIASGNATVTPTGSLTVPTTLLTTPTLVATTQAAAPTANGAAGQAVASIGSLFLAVAAMFTLAF